MSPVARRGDQGREAGGPRVPRRDSRAGASRPELPRHARARYAGRLGSGAARPRDDPPVRDPARGRRDAREPSARHSSTTSESSRRSFGHSRPIASLRSASLYATSAARVFRRAPLAAVPPPRGAARLRRRLAAVRDDVPRQLARRAAGPRRPRRGEAAQGGDSGAGRGSPRPEAAARLRRMLEVVRTLGLAGAPARRRADARDELRPFGRARARTRPRRRCTSSATGATSSARCSSAAGSARSAPAPTTRASPTAPTPASGSSPSARRSSRRRARRGGRRGRGAATSPPREPSPSGRSSSATKSSSRARSRSQEPLADVPRPRAGAADQIALDRLRPFSRALADET